VLTERDRDGREAELLGLDGLPPDRWCFVGYASGALHRAGWLIVDSQVSERLDASSTPDGCSAPFFGQVFGPRSTRDTVRAGWHATGQGRLELGRAWLIGRDCQPSTLMRLRDSFLRQYL